MYVPLANMFQAASRTCLPCIR